MDMKITSLNIDDIIRNERSKLRQNGYCVNDYCFEWGKDGYEALNKFYGAIICRKHGISCDLCVKWPAKLLKKNQGLTFMGIKHFWDKKKEGYLIRKT